MSWIIPWATPASNDPARKIRIAVWNMIRRPYRSLTLPYSGVQTVELSRYAVTTQE